VDARGSLRLQVADGPPISLCGAGVCLLVLSIADRSDVHKRDAFLYPVHGCTFILLQEMWNTEGARVKTIMCGKEDTDLGV